MQTAPAPDLHQTGGVAPHPPGAQMVMVPMAYSMAYLHMWPKTLAMPALIVGCVGFVMGGGIACIVGLVMAYSAKGVVEQYPGHPDTDLVKTALVVNWILAGFIGLILVIALGFIIVLLVMVAATDTL